MRGEQHALISILSGGLILLPLGGVLSPELVLIALGGIFIGSLAPDADTPDTAILHGLRGGKGIARALRQHTVIALPLIGIVIRYGIYFPMSACMWVLSMGRIKAHHRGLLHSLFGILVTTVFLTLIIGLGASMLNFQGNKFIAVFAVAFFTGSFLHLLEDACTRNGVAWGYPFTERRMRGNLATGNRREKRPEILGAVLGGSTFFFVIAGSLLLLPEVIHSFAPLFTLVACWTFFLFSAGIRFK